MANTYTLINSNTVGSGGVASITFSSIPATYTDLQLYVSAQGTTSVNYGADLKVVFNGSGGTAYSWKNLEGYDSSAGSNGGTGQAYVLGGFCPTTSQASWGSNSIYIPNYAGSNSKSLSVEAVSGKNATTSWIIDMVAGLWANSSAITQIGLTLSTGNFAQYSTAYLYGIKNS